MEDRVILAPFTDVQVRRLNLWQKAGKGHPFTCLRRGDGNHKVYDDGDLGELVATPGGWFCRDCDYTQVTAFDFMVSNETAAWMLSKSPLG